jgi:hypothetical protein
MRLGREEADALLRADCAACDGGDATPDAAARGGASKPNSSPSLKQGGAEAARYAGGGGSATVGSAHLLHALALELLQRRSLGATATASPLLLQLDAQQLAVASGGRLLRSLPLPAGRPAATAPTTQAVPLPPVVPHLKGVSPPFIMLPPEASALGQRGAAAQVTLVLTGCGLWAHDGSPGLVLCHQHGECRWCSCSSPCGMPSHSCVTLLLPSRYLLC